MAAVVRAFANDGEFLEYIQATHFDYFWYGANPANGLIPDRLPSPSPCSIAAVGFGLSAICIGIDHGWITRTQGVDRVRTTLNTFLQGPQGSGASGTIGYKGWFYHFLDMNSGLRYTSFNSELSSIDTALLLAGMLHAKQYFNQQNSDESAIQTMVDTIINRVDWNWMARGTNVLSMGWQPASGFLASNWIGYNEAMILYCLGLGAATNPLPASAWTRWTSGYAWATYYGQSYVPFAPLFGHQYSHCWIDFRHIADGYMNSRHSTYFENSRRATVAQRAYCIANPLARAGYSSNVWGLTACDGPAGYSARGAPPAQNDDGTIAPTAAGGSIAFTPEYSLAALRHFYTRFRRSVWTAYGFRDAFNQGEQWWGPDEIGIDQGPIVMMIENYRTQKVWRLFMQNPEIQRGLERAGFVPLSFMVPRLEPLFQQSAFSLNWEALAGRTYQVEYSPDLAAWFESPTGQVTATNSAAGWLDNGPPATSALPFSVAHRFYRVYQFGPP
ncbi:MAG: Tat pathway signal protein [Planctomycetaceae bacterium]|nr:MAG: Tat pathway signal protein [Planctomycetaceae bacterium]